MQLLNALYGALATALVLTAGALIRRARRYGGAEEREISTRAANSAVEAVNEVLDAMRDERRDLLAKISELERIERHKGLAVGEMEAELGVRMRRIVALEGELNP